jgi:uncharacterized Tic20 family protein
MSSHEPIRLPQPDEIPAREKDDAMGAYLMMFAAWAVGLPFPVLNLVAAFIYFMINRKKSRFVAFHSLQSLLSQIPVTVGNLAVIVWLVSILVTEMIFPQRFFAFLYFMIAINIVYVIYSIVALVRARRGSFFYMPFFGRAAFARYYGPNAVPLEKPVDPNRPPEGF